MIAALIHPDGHLTALRGTLTADPASIAALGHAVHAAGHELALRAGTSAVQSITLNGATGCLTLLPMPQGVLLMEHEKPVPPEVLQTMAEACLAQPAPPQVSPPTAPISLADALHAAAP